MRKKRSLKKDNNTKVAVIFVGFVLTIVLVSLIFKFVVLLSQSQFDNAKRFTMTVSNKNDVEVISFSPISRSISVLKLDADIDVPLNQFLAIPIDGFVKKDSLDINQKVGSLFPEMIFNYKKLNTNLTIVDLVKLFIFTKSLKDREIVERSISKDLAAGDIDSLARRLFNEGLIEEEGKKIQIINSTDVLGLGNRLARLITNMGGDVIIVVTGNEPQESSEISYIDDKNYTVERLSKVLGYSTVKVTDRTIADVTITIGQDSLQSLVF